MADAPHHFADIWRFASASAIAYNGSGSGIARSAAAPSPNAAPFNKARWHYHARGKMIDDWPDRQNRINSTRWLAPVVSHLGADEQRQVGPELTPSTTLAEFGD